MFTITTIREDTCGACHTIGLGVEFVLQQDPGAKNFLCWQHFRMTREAMRVASMLPVDGSKASQSGVRGDALAPPPTLRQSVLIGPTSPREERSRDVESTRQSFLHGQTKGGTDGRDTGGEG
jgi:hypothetical protein